MKLWSPKRGGSVKWKHGENRDIDMNPSFDQQAWKFFIFDAYFVSKWNLNGSESFK